MWTYPKHYAVIVIGGGHAGCEAAFASARMGAETLLLTMTLDTIGKMSCNPAVGGVAKGHMVREIDALGGEMGKVTDQTAIQFRMLNASKGPAVWAPRAQADRVRYQYEMKRRLELQPGLEIKQGSVEDLEVEDGRVCGVRTQEGIRYTCDAVVISSGTFMRGLIHIGETNYSGGRACDRPSVGMSASLERLGIKLGRLKTGTPPRIHRRGIDFSMTEEQPGDPGVRFSFDPDDGKRLPQVSCYITYTTDETKKVIQRNIHRSPMYSGKITGIGPRYCPSIEDKVMRFADKERHQLFLEPEGLDTQEFYVNGISSSLPFDVQYEVIKSIPALRNAEVMRPAYAIEYDYAVCGQIDYTLETRAIKGLFFAGQVNGTSGYEEAAGQGLMAGINAACGVLGKPPLVLKRSESYIGVMIDDIVTKGLDEPYRMFTSRAEHRLLLRQDNADLRLRRYGYDLGIVPEDAYQRLVLKENTIADELVRLHKSFRQVNGKGISLAQLLARPESNYRDLVSAHPDDFRDFGDDTNLQIELICKYAGYIKRQEEEIGRLDRVEDIRIPDNFDYGITIGLRAEAQQKLKRLRPSNLGQASRIAGVSPADISVLMVALEKRSR